MRDGDIKKEYAADWRYLSDLITSPDPKIRDGWAMDMLYEGIKNGAFKSDLVSIKEEAISHFNHENVEARAFAPLVLMWLMEAGVRDRDIFEALSRWYLNERETLGYDLKKGWIHAIAHGADCLSDCAFFNIATGDEVLEILAKRVLTGGDVWLFNEQARVVRAIIKTIIHCPSVDLNNFFKILGRGFRDDYYSFDKTFSTAGLLTNRQLVLSLLYTSTYAPIVINGKRVDIPKAEDIRHALDKILDRDIPWLFNIR